MRWTQVLAWSFYEPPDRPVRVLRMDLRDDDRHQLLVDVWVMAWPALRTGVSFCDAPRTQRALDDQPFDLQLQQTTRANSPDIAEARILRGMPAAEPPVWAKHLAAEFTSKAFSQFIAVHGPQLEPSRGFVRSLVRLFDAYQVGGKRKNGRAESVVAVLADEFPDPESAVALKAQLLSSGQDASTRLDDPGVLRGLVATATPQAFANVDLELEERVGRLYAADASSLWSALGAIGDGKQPIADAALAALVDVSTTDGFAHWSKQPPATIGRLLKRRPDVLEIPDIWQSLDPEVLWRAAARERGVRRRAAIVHAIVAADLSSLSSKITSAWNVGGDLLLASLASAGRLSTADLAVWLDPIPVETLLRFLSGEVEVTDALAAAAVRRLDAKAIASIGPDYVKAAMRGDSDIGVAVGAFLAALERPQDSTWAEIGTVAYCKVVGRASKDELGPARERLKGVETELPEWDVVARVARAASRAFKDGRWPIETALEIKDRAAFAALLRADKRAGLARAMLVAAAEGRVTVTAWQRDLISTTIRERSDKDSLLKTIEGLAKGIFRF